MQYEWEPEQRSGLYFLLHLSSNDSALEDRLHAALNLLEEEGLGGERSSGAGRFKATWSDLDPLWNQVINFPQPNAHSLISLFWPLSLPEYLSPENLQNNPTNVAYALQERGGWIASPFSGQQRRRKSVRMFTEGSVFPVAPIGQLADVTPERFKTHSIYRSGISLSLPVHLASSFLCLLLTRL